MFWLMLIINFAISWFNAHSAGKYWSESKEIGGVFRFNCIVGYILSIVGFTMVYGTILLLIFPYVTPLIPALQETDLSVIQELTSNLLFLLIVVAIIPLGYIVLFQSFMAFWKNRTLKNAAITGWNVYANVRNTVTAARYAPDAFNKVIEFMFKGKKKGKEVVIYVALFIVILAICGGYFTASAILKKSDKEVDGFEFAS